MPSKVNLDQHPRLTSLIIIIILSPIIIFIATRLLISQKKCPLIFTQVRIGHYQRPFTIFKFQTLLRTENGSTLPIDNFCRFLRNTRLDELPQLFNVLKGDMHLIGPRPYSLQDHSNMAKIPRFLNRYTVKPGITGYAQSIGLHGPMHSTIERLKRLEADLYYINNRSLIGDLRIIFKTLKIALNL